MRPAVRIAYHYTIPEPPEPALDAAVQDGRRLAERFGGEIGYLYPGRAIRPWLPPALGGLGQGRRLRRLDREADLHHLFSHGPYALPLLGGLRKPLVYTLVPSLRSPRAPWARRFLRRARVVVAPTDRDAGVLRSWGLRDVRVVPSAIDLDRFHRRPAPEGDGFVLLLGSAPWSRKQFRTKGVDLLLEALARRPDLRLVALWRGLHLDEMRRRVLRHGLAERVEILDRPVDVDRVLAGVHAAVVLARSPHLVKPFPHSLLESLAAGRPVLASRGLAAADWIRERGGGEVVEELTAAGLLDAIDRLRRHYEEHRTVVRVLDLSEFGLPRFFASYGKIYAEAAGGRS